MSFDSQDECLFSPLVRLGLSLLGERMSGRGDVIVVCAVAHRVLAVVTSWTDGVGAAYCLGSSLLGERTS